LSTESPRRSAAEEARRRVIASGIEFAGSADRA